jgi:hypothetical protein
MAMPSKLEETTRLRSGAWRSVLDRDGFSVIAEQVAAGSGFAHEVRTRPDKPADEKKCRLHRIAVDACGR